MIPLARFRRAASPTAMKNLSGRTRTDSSAPRWVQRKEERLTRVPADFLPMCTLVKWRYNCSPSSKIKSQSSHSHCTGASLSMVDFVIPVAAPLLLRARFRKRLSQKAKNILATWSELVRDMLFSPSPRSHFIPAR